MKSLQHLVAAVSLLALTACHTPLPPVAAPPAQVAGELTQYKPLAADLGVKGSGPSFSIRYLSTNGVTGTGLVPVTGAVIYPAGPAPAGGWPIVAWLMAPWALQIAVPPHATPVPPGTRHTWGNGYTGALPLLPRIIRAWGVTARTRT